MKSHSGNKYILKGKVVSMHLTVSLSLSLSLHTHRFTPCKTSRLSRACVHAGGNGHERV
jgi:hypothetical protein